MTDHGALLTRLVLLRHAEAITARGDPALSKRGLQQAERLRRRLIDTGELRASTVLATSGLVRAVQTGTLITDAIGDGSLRMHREPAFNEMSWDLERNAPAETWAVFEQRVRSALTKYANMATGSTAVIVCHTGVVEASFIEFAGLHRRSQRFAMSPRHASLTTWVTSAEEQPLRMWRLERYNDCAHLWERGALCHAPEEFESLGTGREPFWEGLDGDR
jgi:probable phosphoglycerate mutase